MNTSPLVPTYWRDQGIEQVLIDEASIARRVRELGQELSLEFADGKDVVLVAVLTGAVVFAADLMRAIPTRVAISMVSVTSYGASTTSQGAVLSSALPKNLAGKHVVIVDEVLEVISTSRMLTRPER